MAQLHMYSTVTREWNNYTGMTQLNGIEQLYAYGTITRIWHNYVDMAQLRGYGTITWCSTIVRVRHNYSANEKKHKQPDITTGIVIIRTVMIIMLGTQIYEFVQ
jgi:hypothetical protein